MIAPHDGTPIVVHPDAPLTLNYLDTQGLPLTQLHLATAVALLARMVGAPETAEQLALRQTQLTQYLHPLYRDTFTDRSRRRPEQAEGVRRLACAVHRWREKMPTGATPLEAFVDLRDRRAAHQDEALAFVATLPEEAIARFAQHPETERFLAQTACAFFTPEEFPTHSALVELLAYARFPEHNNKDETDRLATLLRAWSVEGQYGKLFDGVTNVSLPRKNRALRAGFYSRAGRGAEGRRRSPHQRARAPAHPGTAARPAEADAVRGARTVLGHARRRTNCGRGLRAAPQVQLLGHFDHPAIRAEEVGKISNPNVGGFRRSLSVEEILRLLVKAPRHRPVVYHTIVYTGLRRSEMNGLKWDDFKWEDAILTSAFRPADAKPEDFVFRGLMPRVPTLKRDLAAAGIPSEDTRAAASTSMPCAKHTERCSPSPEFRRASRWN